MASNRKTPDPGGVIWTTATNRTVDDAFQRDLRGFNAYEKGLEIGRMMPYIAAPITDEPERSLRSLSDIHRAALSGCAHRVLLAALDTIKRRPKELNTAAILAQAKTELKALGTATVEKVTPVVIRLNEQLGELNFFLAFHRRGPLGDNDYSPDCTMLKPLLLAATVAAVDAVLNAGQYVPVMPGGVRDAILISGFMSLGEAAAGAFAGTALRYWTYAEPARRLVWRAAGITATLLAVGMAGLFAQYRAVLETFAKLGGEPNLAAILSTSPTIMSVTVFVGATVVFIVAAMKCRGGAGSPWALYGDQAKFDREVRRTTQRLEGLKRSYFRAIRQISADALGNFEEFDYADRLMLQDAYGARDKAKLEIRDLRTSDEAYFKLMRNAIHRFRDGVMAVRPEVTPEQFPPVPTYAAEDFPDPTELDTAVAETEAIFSARTEQLARMETEVGALEQAAMEEFTARIEQIRNAGEKQRIRDRKVRRIGDEPDEVPV